jgi:hypothetical protein
MVIVYSCFIVAACCLWTGSAEVLKWESVVQQRGTHSGNPASPLDLRVTPGFGPKGYGKVRISVVTNVSSPLPDPGGFWQYKEPFQYRWTNKYLHSSLKTVHTDGSPTVFNINGTEVTVQYPKENAGVRGVIIADPCFHGAEDGCSYGEKYNTFERMTALMNAVAVDIDYWMILGDNFYDRFGGLSTAWFDQLTLETKSKVFATVAGNHDYWAYGSPIVAVPDDQFGNGHMQFYAMDAVSSSHSDVLSPPGGVPFLNFSIDPDKSKAGNRLPSAENFFSYFKLGNAAFVLYSGGYEYSTTKTYFQQGCAYLKEAKPDVAFLVGHWNYYAGGVMGCEKDMDVPDVYSEIKGYDGCAQLDAKDSLKYVMGHVHCNKVTEKDKGFMLAGQGMEGCGNFGVPYVDTSDGRVEIIYYNVQDKTGTDEYDKIMACFKAHGPAKCKDLGTVWLNQTIGTKE